MADTTAAAPLQLERFREDLSGEVSKLSGHTLLVVQSILDSLQHVIDNEYTVKYTLPGSVASTPPTPTLPAGNEIVATATATKVEVHKQTTPVLL
jgi:hypothetical protein